MEKQPVEDVSPIKNGELPASHLSCLEGFFDAIFDDIFPFLKSKTSEGRASDWM